MDSGGTGIELDRISSLHDSILCHILSFLPTKLAVGTSILSSRWRYLWVYAPTLIFNDTDISEERELTFEDQEELNVIFADFVNRVLHFSKLQPLQEFHLSCTSVEYLYIHIDILHSWIDAAISRNLQIMSICIHLGDPVDLPLSIYISETLVELMLVYSFLPFPASVWLPSLKVLWLLEVLYENDETAQVLYSGCPVLERLHIERNLYSDFRPSLNFVVPTVKNLHFSNYTLDGDFSNAEETNHLTVNAPNMEYFHLGDNISDDFTIANVSSLLQAYVSVNKAFKTPDRFSRYLGNLYNLLSGIAHVRTLTLALFYESTPSFPINWSDYAVPIFLKLTNLEFHANGASGWNSLMCFLHSSPKLKVLGIKQKSDVDSADFWSPPQQVPKCMLVCLEEIQIMSFSGTEFELKGIEYLLKHTKNLRKMEINCWPLRMKGLEVGLREKLARFGFRSLSASNRLTLDLSAAKLDS